MLEKLKAILAKLGITIPNEKEAELKAEIDKLEKDSNGNIDFSKLDLSKFTSTNDNPLLKTIIEQNQTLIQTNKDLQNALAKEQQEREAGIKSAGERAKAEQAKKVEDAITKALKEKRIVEADKEIWKGRLEKDYDEWNKELESKPAPKQFGNDSQKSDKSKSDADNDKGKSTSPLKNLTDAIRDQMDSNQSKV